MDEKDVDGYPGKILGSSQKKRALISDGATHLSFKQTVLDGKQKQTIVMQPSGGFVLEYE